MSHGEFVVFCSHGGGGGGGVGGGRSEGFPGQVWNVGGGVSPPGLWNWRPLKAGSLFVPEKWISSVLSDEALLLLLSHVLRHILESCDCLAPVTLPWSPTPTPQGWL